MSKFLFIGGRKGGTTKTTTSHLLALGAVLRNQPAAYVLTDPTRQVRSAGRPYAVLDGRDPQKLAQIITASRNTDNGWLIVDGGGNRPNFDSEVSGVAQLTLLPFRASEEDLDSTVQDMQAMPSAVAWPAAWTTNSYAKEAAQYYIDALDKAFPGRVIKEPIHFVNAASELLAATLEAPSSPVRNAARRAFGIMDEFFDNYTAEPAAQGRGERRA